MSLMNELLASKKGQDDNKKNYLTQLFNSFTNKLQNQSEDQPSDPSKTTSTPNGE